MVVKIIRGQNQIGGNIVEISTENTRILLDAGVELDNDASIPCAVEDLFTPSLYDAIFISHYHRDHFGLTYYIDKSVPIYIGEAAYKIVKSSDDYRGVDSICPAGFLVDQNPIIVGDIKVTPYLCDHSAYDSYMLLCESAGELVLYTGDFRSNGRKSFKGLLKRLPDKVDKLICEGTTLSRDSEIFLTESEIEKLAVKAFKNTAGPIFVLQSSTNIDRIVTMYRAAKRTGRVFLEELYMAEIAASPGGSIPNPDFSDVYAFITNPSRYEDLTGFRRIGKKQIAKSKFVMCVRSSMLGYLKSLNKLMDFDNGLLVYSMWNGYKVKAEMKEFISECEAMGLRIIDLHTSGHADHKTISALIDRLKPTEIIPIHTENPDWF